MPLKVRPVAAKLYGRHVHQQKQEQEHDIRSACDILDRQCYRHSRNYQTGSDDGSVRRSFYPVYEAEDVWQIMIPSHCK